MHFVCSFDPKLSPKTYWRVPASLEVETGWGRAEWSGGGGEERKVETQVKPGGGEVEVEGCGDCGKTGRRRGRCRLEGSRVEGRVEERDVESVGKPEGGEGGGEGQREGGGDWGRAGWRRGRWRLGESRVEEGGRGRWTGEESAEGEGGGDGEEPGGGEGEEEVETEGEFSERERGGEGVPDVIVSLLESSLH